MSNSVERYYERKKKRKKRTKIIFISALGVLLMLLLVILSVTVFFNAETIIVEGNTHYSVETLLEQGGLKVGQNLFRLDKFEVIEKMEQLPYVKEVTIDRQLPSTLEIHVVENQAVVWMETEKMDKNFFKKIIDDYNVNDHAEGLALTFVVGCIVVILNMMNFAN